METAKSDPLIK